MAVELLHTVIRNRSTVKGKYEVDEEAAEVVRYIFRLRSERTMDIAVL